jgi:regulator of protease activity HflC (stomatin/prohibitin superfamily)
MVFIVYLILAYIVASIKVINEYERGVKFTLGRFSGLLQPGLKFVFPFIQSWQRIDIRTNVVDIPKQDTMTSDNVSVQINAVMYFKVTDAKLSVLEVIDYKYTINQLAQTTMRDVIGEITLDELLSKREQISKKIKEILDKATDPFGLKVETVELKDIILPDSLIRVISKEAEAEREKRAVIIKAEGEASAAKNLVKAAKELNKVTGGLHIRTLQTINNLGNEKSHTNVYALPEEILKKFGIK